MARPVASLDALLSEADVLTLHLPATAETRGIIGPAEIAKMKPGAFLLNNARGSLVDLDALADALWSGQVAGAAVDVFPVEPKSKAEPLETPLRGLENVILTPHIGGATQEAQQQIGLEVARKLTAYIEHGSTIGAVNLPQAQLPAPVGVTRFLQLAANPASALERMAAAFAQRALPIVAQHCFGDAEIGYVVVDVAGDLPHAEEIERELRAAPHAIRVRALRPTAGVAAHLDPIRLAS
ncbi:MAG: NAD(P)-dependent oxidoreductase [Pseudomonadota bacterium]